MILKDSCETAFTEALPAWQTRHKTCLNARSVHPQTGRYSYTDKRLRSAYNSLKRHFPYLFTCERHPELNIPNTINLLEGEFGNLKRLLRYRQGMRRENKPRFIKYYFAKLKA